MRLVLAMKHLLEIAPAWVYLLVIAGIGSRIYRIHHEMKFERKQAELEQKNQRILHELRYGKYLSEQENTASSPTNAVVRDGNVSTMPGQQVEKTKKSESSNLKNIVIKSIAITGGIIFGVLATFYAVGFLIW